MAVAGRMSVAEKEEIWRLLRAGVSFRVIGRQLGRSDATIQQYVGLTGGVPPRQRSRAANQGSLGEREEISRGMAAGESMRAVAWRLGRSPSTVSRELVRNGGRRRYRAAAADGAAWTRARRPKHCKLAANARLRKTVAVKLGEDWSPQQIAGWLVRTFPDEPEMRVSHETIYLTLFVQSRGALKRELATHLRTRRMKRRSQAHTSRGHGRGQIVDAIAISERPAEVEDRAVPGHWEGDLLIGSGRSQIATLVERSTRFVMLVRLPEGRSTEHVVTALAAQIQTLPVQLRRTLTGPRTRARRPQEVHRRHRRAGLLLRPQESVAARLEREHQRSVAPVLPQGHQHRRLHPGAARRDRRQAQRTPSTDPGLDDTVREASRGVALTS